MESSSASGEEAPAKHAIPASAAAAAGTTSRPGRAEARGSIEDIKQEWEATIDSLPLLVFLLDEDGRIIRTNLTVERWGIGRIETSLGKRLHEFLHPACGCAQCYLEDFWLLRHDLSLSDKVCVHRGQDPVLKRHVEMQLHSYRRPSARGGHGGSSHGAVVTITDITELVTAEEALRALNNDLEARINDRTAELQEANRRLRQEIMERRRAEKALKDSESELRHLSMQVLTAQEKERKRIAHELHDGIGQTLSAVKFYVEGALNSVDCTLPADGLAKCMSIIPKLQIAIEEVRHISMDLRPSMLDDFGILATLSWFCREYQQVYQDIQVTCTADVREEEIPADLKVVIFRIVQEALNNIAKHARASQANVLLKRDKRALVLKISDNGMGFDPINRAIKQQHGKGGTGLVSMRERAEYSGGEWQIETVKGKGTRIGIVWRGLVG